MKRELEREKRDREFWITMFGGKSDSMSSVEESGEGVLLKMADVPFGTR
jgi:hypothetical protein